MAGGGEKSEREGKVEEVTGGEEKRVRGNEEGERERGGGRGEEEEAGHLLFCHSKEG